MWAGGLRSSEQIMAFNGVGMGFRSCSRVVFGVAIVLFLCNVSTSAPTVSASSEVTTWSEELQFARAEGKCTVPSKWRMSGKLFVPVQIFLLLHRIWKSDDVFTMVLGDGQKCKLRSVM